VYKDKSFEVVKTRLQLFNKAKLKSGLVSLIVKKVASVTWEQIRAIVEDKIRLKCIHLRVRNEYGCWNS
jgi:large subunit ribosomal protein L11